MIHSSPNNILEEIGPWIISEIHLAFWAEHEYTNHQEHVKTGLKYAFNVPIYELYLYQTYGRNRWAMESVAPELPQGGGEGREVRGLGRIFHNPSMRSLWILTHLELPYAFIYIFRPQEGGSLPPSPHPVTYAPDRICEFIARRGNHQTTKVKYASAAFGLQLKGSVTPLHTNGSCLLEKLHQRLSIANIGKMFS